MEIDNHHPLSYFEYLLEFNRYNELKETFVNSFKNYTSPENINLDKGEVKLWEPYYDELKGIQEEKFITRTFQRTYEITLTVESQKAQKAIEDTVNSILRNGKDANEYLKFIKEQLSKLLIRSTIYSRELPNVKASILHLFEFIDEKYFVKSSDKSKRTTNNQNEIPRDNYSQYSFKWDALNEDDILPSIEQLYKLVTAKPAIIEASKEDFIAAFTKRKVIFGLKWKVISKNKKTSKISLFYFIYSLIEQGYIESVPSEELNKIVKYLFRDNDGEAFKNIGQSKYSISENPTQKKRMDIILNNIII